MNADTMEIVTEFNGTKGMVDVEFTISKAGSYGIYLNEKELIGMIDVADDISSINVEDVRSNYLN